MVPTSAPRDAQEPYRITVVCLGNICRSPMGESVLRARVADAGLSDRIVVDSAGTGTWHTGYGADPRTREVLTASGYDDLATHEARRITATWFAEIDLALAMDMSNYADLADLIARSGVDTELRMMRAFDPTLSHVPEPHPGLDVPDPYYGGTDGFVDALRMLERASDGLIDRLTRDLS